MFDQRTGVCLYILKVMKKEPGEKGGNMKGGKEVDMNLGVRSQTQILTY